MLIKNFLDKIILKKSDIFFFIPMFFIIMFSFFQLWVVWISLIFIPLEVALFVLLWYWYRKIKTKMLKKEYQPITYEWFMVRVWKWILSWFRAVGLFFIIMFSLIYYVLNIDPLQAPKYTLTNWDKTIIFQWMMHIWKSEFFDSITKEINNYKNDNYTIALEWITLVDKKNLEKFQNLMGFRFDSETYKLIAESMGLIEQNTAKMVWGIDKIDNKSIKNVDVSIDELVNLYEEKYNTKLETYKEKEPVKLEIKPLLDIFDKFLTNSWKEAIKYTRIAWLNLSRIEFLQKTMGTMLMKDNTMEIILEYRNDYIVKYINSETNNKIYINYGMLHFNGVLERLQTQDPNWKIVKTETQDILPKLTFK